MGHPGFWYPTLNAKAAFRMEHPAFWYPTLNAKGAFRMGHPAILVSQAKSSWRFLGWGMRPV
jgi:hypothetical protein